MKPLWISHRGFTHSAVENTLGAFRAAVDHGFTALETDLRLTRDGHVVLHHDLNLTRITGSSGLIHDKSRSEIESLRPKLTFLDEFVVEFLSCSWTFDLKLETASGVIDQLVKMVRTGGPVAKKIAHSRFVTWSREHEFRLKRLFPNAAFYALERECWRAGFAVLAHVPQLGGIVPGRAYAVPARIGQRQLFNADLVAAFHQRGARITAFLPETNEDAYAAVEAGFDEILTNGRIVG